MKTFLGKKLLVVTAHPDDESYLMSGSFIKNHQVGGKNYIICATFGERGSAYLKKPVTSANLKNIRKQELVKVSKFLKVNKLITLGLPDGGVKDYHRKLLSKISTVAKELEPDVVISYGKDGISGHLDHIAVGKAAKEVAKKLNIDFLVFSKPANLMRQSSKWMLARRKMGKYRKLILPKAPTIKVNIKPAIKLKALSMHKSQFDQVPFADYPRALANKLWLRTEYFSEIYHD